MTVYIEEYAWASCTFDLAGSPQQLIKQDDRRVVGYVGQDRLLTIDDRATKEKFSCKLVAKQWGGLLALVGGIAIGTTLVLSGPVGWVALGAVVVVAIGTPIAMSQHDCSNPLQNGQWELAHYTVRIRGKEAVLYDRSQLHCGNGGVLVASETHAAAQELSDAMKWKARLEVGVQILSNAVIGVVVGYGVYDRAPNDWDLASPFLAVTSYYETDFEHATDYTPCQSFLAGLKYSAIGYGLGEMNRVPGLGWTKGWLGTEVASTEDWLVTCVIAVLGLGADSLESYLQNLNADIAKNAAGRSTAASDKTIICVDV